MSFFNISLGLHDFVSQTDALEKTGAGVRHKDFLGELLKHLDYDKANNQIKCIISNMELYDQIRSLNQSYFNPSTHSLKSNEIVPFVNKVNEFLDAKPLYEEDNILRI